LAQSDMSWKAAAVQTAKVAKGASVEAPRPEVSPFGMMLGAQSGYARPSGSANMPYGPFVELNYRYPVYQDPRWTLHLGGALNAHRHKEDRSDVEFISYAGQTVPETSGSGTAATSRFSTVTTDTVAAYAVVGAAYQTPWQAVPLAIAWETGYGQAYHDQTIKGDWMEVNTGGYVPAYLYGFRFELPLRSGRRVGIVARREKMILGNTGISPSEVTAETFALSTSL
jgi:hypothetical protein